MGRLSAKEALAAYEMWYRSLLVFVQDMFQHHLTSAVPEFHKGIYKLVVQYQRLLLAAPRGFAKSMICSVFYPLWAALVGDKKDICIISASEGLAVEWLRKIRRELESNSKIHEAFGELKSSKWTENHIILNNANKTNIRARGSGGQIRGFRPDCIILDDIETDDSVASSEQRNKLREWIFKSCLNTLLPHGQMLWIGTIISPLALLQEQLETDNAWEKRKFRAYKDGRQEAGNELWPELWTHDKLQARKREIGSTAFASEYLNDPVLNESAAIQRHHIRHWRELPAQYSAVIAVDPAYSEEAKADYKVASLIGIDQNANRYLISYIRTHRPSGEFMDAILNLYLQNKNVITGIGIPNAGTEKEFYNSFINKAHGRKLYPPVMGLKNVFKRGTDKVIRRKKDRIVAALQPLFESGKYYIHSSHKDAEDELLTIGASRWDDIVDTLAYAEQIITPVYTEPDVKAFDRYGHPIEEVDEFSNNYGYDY